MGSLNKQFSVKSGQIEQKFSYIDLTDGDMVVQLFYSTFCLINIMQLSKLMPTFVPQGPLSLLPSMDSSSVKAAMVSDDLFA